MSNYSKIYWLTRLDNLNGFFIAALAIGIVGVVIYLLVSAFLIAEGNTGISKQYRKYKTWAIALLLFGALGLTFMPTRNEMIMIYAGGKALNFVQSDTSLNKIPYQATSIISNYLDKQIKDVKK